MSTETLCRAGAVLSGAPAASPAEPRDSAAVIRDYPRLLDFFFTRVFSPELRFATSGASTTVFGFSA